MPPDAGVDREMLRVMALLVASYPWQRVDDLTPEAYAMQLADLPVPEVELAVLTLNATPGRRNLPSVGEIRGAVAERRLELPTPTEAWEWVSRAASTPLRYEACSVCGATGYADEARETFCRECRGSAELEVGRRPLVSGMPPPLLRAFRAVGGATGIAAAKPEVVRAQFLRAYEDISRRALASESHGSAGLELPRRTIPAIGSG